MRWGFSITKLAACLLASLCCFVSFGALAQQQPEAPAESTQTREKPDRGVLDEIIVTGTKREQAQQDTPIAISTITPKQIENTFQSDVRTLSNLSPNLTMTNVTGFNAVAPGIRGTQTGFILVMQDSTVGMLIDDFSIGHVQSQFVELFDLEQVEVYRGPQGTLFGKNTAGGVVSITTKKPRLDEFGMDLALTYGSYSEGGGDITRGKFAIDVPLMENKLGFRFAGVYDYNEGYYQNDKNTATFPNLVPLWLAFGIPPGTPTPPGLDTTTVGGGEDLGGFDVFAGKAKLLYQPNDFYDAYLIYEYVRDRSDSPPGVNETPAGDGVTEDFMLLELLGFPGIQQAGHSDVFSTGVTGNDSPIKIRNGHQVDVQGVYLYNTFNFRDLLGIGDFQLKSISGYRYQVETLPSTYTGEAFLSLFDATRNLERNSVQQELRLVSELDGPFNFVAGAVYFRDDVDFHVYANVGLSGLIPVFNPATGNFLDNSGNVNLDLDFINDPATSSAKQDRRSWAIYLDGSYNLSERLRVSAGLRYTYDDKEFWRDQNPGGECTALTPLKDQRIVGGTCLDARSTAVSRSGLQRDQVSQRRLPLQSDSYEIRLAGVDEDWDKLTWRLALDYSLSDEIMAYFTTATGFTSGGFTETCSSLATCEPYNEEESLNFEAGIKSDLLDNTVRANLAFFYTEYDDLQRNQVVPFTNLFGVTTQETTTINAAKGNAWGVEFETTWVPIPEFRLDLSVSYLDFEYDEFDVALPCSPNIVRKIGRAGPGPDGVWGTSPTDPASADDVAGCGDPVNAQSARGNPSDDGAFLDSPFAQHWQVGVSATYEQRFDFGNLTWYASYHWQDEGEFSAFNSTLTQLEERALLGLSVQFRDPSERYFVTLWGQNLLNEEYRVSANSVAGLWNFTQYGPPRSMGVEVGFRY